MFAVITRALRQHRESAALISEVWSAFQKKYPERIILKNWQAKPQRGKDGTVVCVVWNSNTRPPRRTWWVKKEEGIDEISGDEVSRHFDIGRYL
jgi:hypothetical protein